MIDVLLATYKPNLEWLKLQEDSVCTQVGVALNLIRREDEAGVGPNDNFSKLLNQSRAEYVAFCDQDDIWEPNKLRCLQAEMDALEAKYGKNMPILVFSDSMLMAENGESLGVTHIGMQQVEVGVGLKFNRLLMQNFIPGHSMLINAALRKCISSIPLEAVMYDWWIALIASAYGKIAYVNKPLVKYRQYGGNVLGAINKSQSMVEFKTRLCQSIRQAQAFVSAFGEMAPAEVKALAEIDKHNWIMRRVIIIRNGLFKHGVKRNLALLVLI